MNTPDFSKMNGLVPAIIQNSNTGTVLMMGYMNEESFAQTLSTGKVTFWSRSRKKLWVKGETSGNYLNLIDMYTDCDKDCILIKAKPSGPACHTGTESCFGDNSRNDIGFLNELYDLVADRKIQAPEKSYTASLFKKGTKRIAQKVGEEAVEVSLASMTGDKKEIAEESADLLFHLFVLLNQTEVSLDNVIDVLKKRHQKSGKLEDPQ